MSLRRASCFTVLSFALASTGCQAPAPETRERPRFEVLALEHADATALAGALARVFAGSSVRVEPDVRTNSLLLAGAIEELADAKAVVARLDAQVPETSKASYVLIPLEHATAAEVREALIGVGQTESSRISVDARTNSLLVEATPESLARIQDVVAHLDQDCRTFPTGTKQ